MRTVSAQRLAVLVHPESLVRPAYASLAQALRRLVADGRLLPGTRLPGEREVAVALGLSRNTVSAAFEQLRADGFAHTRRGAGTTVTLPGSPPDALHSPASGIGSGLLPRTLPSDVVDLTYAALPATPGISLAFDEAIDELPALLSTSGYTPQGLSVLREALARWYDSRGLPTDPDQVVVTCGAHAALSAILRATLAPGHRVIVETPSYPNAIVGVRRSHLRVVPLPVEPDGWSAAALSATLRHSDARLSYLIPDFQNPTGLLMDADTRADVVTASRDARSILVVDETFAELGLDVRSMPPPVAVFDPDVVTIGSASKTYWAGLRVGWARLPRSLVRPVVEARHSLDLGTPVLEQLVLTQLLARPELLVERRAMVRQMRDALARSLREHVPTWRFTMPPGGLSLWCELPSAHGDQLAAVAERHGLRVARGAQFAAEAAMTSHVRVPVCVPTDECEEVGRRLARAWADAQVEPVVGRPRTRASLIA